MQGTITDMQRKTAAEVSQPKIENRNVLPPQKKEAANLPEKRRKIDYFLFISLATLFLFSCLMPFKIEHYPEYVDWKTISLLSGLFVITTGLRLSNFFRYISKKMVKRVKYENTLALLLISIAAVFSMFLTNDISILIVIPFTLSLTSIIKNDIDKLIILEIIAVNAGSLLSPIGNPQNIYIWHKWHIPFFVFMLKMFPLFLTLFLFLLVLTLLILKKAPLLYHGTNNNLKTNRKLLFTSIVSFVAFILSEELKITVYVLPVIIGVYLVFFKEVLKKTNWSLVILFIVLFIDIHMLSGLNIINNLLHFLKLSRASNLFFSGIALSQIISNVPATFLLADFNVNWTVLAYSVNIGGAGIVTGSLANLIALRLVDSKKIFMRFHIYSFLFLLLSVGIGFLLLFVA
ncbi:MAG: anion transporter [Spirochaetes bacterium]|nr:anion transporter [Spirochaetota bacterium]